MKIHIVSKDETLWKIAKMYQVDFNELLKVNSQLTNPDLIMPGMKINIPKEGKTVTSEAKEISHQAKNPIIKPSPIVKQEEQISQTSNVYMINLENTTLQEAETVPKQETGLGPLPLPVLNNLLKTQSQGSSQGEYHKKSEKPEKPSAKQAYYGEGEKVNMNNQWGPYLAIGGENLASEGFYHQEKMANLPMENHPMIYGPGASYQCQPMPGGMMGPGYPGHSYGHGQHQHQHNHIQQHDQEYGYHHHQQQSQCGQQSNHDYHHQQQSQCGQQSNHDHHHQQQGQYGQQANHHHYHQQQGQIPPQEMQANPYCQPFGQSFPGVQGQQEEHYMPGMM